MHSPHAQHSRLISSLSSHIPTNDRLRRSVYAAIILLGGEPIIADSEDISYNLKFLPRGKEVLGALKQISATLGDEIDDRLDSMSPEEVLAFGPVTLGKTPCMFLQNFLTEKNWQAFERFGHSGLMPYDDLMIIGNLFAQMHVNRAATMLKLKEDPTNPELRELSSFEHLRSSELCVILLAAIYRHKKLNPDTDITFEQLAELSPKATQIGRILEYYDDIVDVFEDYAEERKTGTPTPNTVITEYMRLLRNKPTTEQDRCLHELNSFMDKMNDGNRKTIQLSEMPEMLRDAIYGVVHKSEKEASELRGTSPDRSTSMAYDFAIDLAGSQLKHGWEIGRKNEKQQAIAR